MIAVPTMMLMVLRRDWLQRDWSQRFWHRLAAVLSVKAAVKKSVKEPVKHFARRRPGGM